MFKILNSNRKIGGKSGYQPTTCFKQTTDRQFIDDVISAHNKKRGEHGVPPLRYNGELSKTAQKWAEHLARNGKFEHSHDSLGNQKMGENLAMKWSSQPDYSYTGTDACDQWYNEILKYTFGQSQPSNFSEVGHFTQLIWRGTEQIGVGRAKGSDGKTIVVANYLPAGNVLGRFVENVPPKQGNTANKTSDTSRPGATDNKRSNEPAFSPNNNSNVSGQFFPNAGLSVTSNKSNEKPVKLGTTNDLSNPPRKLNTEKTTNFNPITQHSVTKNINVNNANQSTNNNENFQPHTFTFNTEGKPINNMSKVSTSTRTYTKTEGYGANKVTKTIVEETITYSDGRKEVNTKETTTSGGGGASSITPSMNKMSLEDRFGASRDNRHATKPSADKPKEQSIKDFRSEGLKAHNTYRSKHGVPPLKQSKDLDDFAQKWADHLASTGTFKHSDCTAKDGTRLGENIACKWSSSGATYTGQEVVDYWYSEVKKHNFNDTRPASSGHFTQVVWKGSKELGMGHATGKDGKAIVVGSYRPAGNMVGDYQANVFPPR